jgi:hypothetical protein
LPGGLTREHIADAMVTAVEDRSPSPSIGHHWKYVLSLSPEEAHGLSSTHTEDAMDFKKEMNQQFYRDVL